MAEHSVKLEKSPFWSRDGLSQYGRQSRWDRHTKDGGCSHGSCVFEPRNTARSEGGGWEAEVKS
jgi:hypothetical protein